METLRSWSSQMIVLIFNGFLMGVAVVVISIQLFLIIFFFWPLPWIFEHSSVHLVCNRIGTLWSTLLLLCSLILICIFVKFVAKRGSRCWHMFSGRCMVTGSCLVPSSFFFGSWSMCPAMIWSDMCALHVCFSLICNISGGVEVCGIICRGRCCIRCGNILSVSSMLSYVCFCDHLRRNSFFCVFRCCMPLICYKDTTMFWSTVFPGGVCLETVLKMCYASFFLCAYVGMKK
jgi:hypothetical protein